MKRIQHFVAVMTAFFCPFVDFFQTTKDAQNPSCHKKKEGKGNLFPPLGGMERNSLSPEYGKLAAAVIPTSGAEVS